MTARPFTGVVEALPMEEWAVRLRVSLDHFKKHYRGPVVRIGANVRVYAADVHDWLDGLASGDANADPWDRVGEDDAQESALSKRKHGQAA